MKHLAPAIIKARLAVAMLLAGFLSSSTMADCGDEVWIVPPGELSERVLYETTAVLTVGLSSGAPLSFASYFPGIGRWEPEMKISANEFAPVSRAPVCDDRSHPLDGARLPIIERAGEYVRIIYNARKKTAVWFKATDLGSSIVDLSSVTVGTALHTGLDAREEAETRVFSFPDEEGDSYTVLPSHHVLVRVAGQQGAFVRLEATRVNRATLKREVVPLGWIRLRSPKGALMLWPWYYDDC